MSMSDVPTGVRASEVPDLMPPDRPVSPGMAARQVRRLLWHSGRGAGLGCALAIVRQLARQVRDERAAKGEMAANKRARLGALDDAAAAIEAEMYAEDER